MVTSVHPDKDGESKQRSVDECGEEIKSDGNTRGDRNVGATSGSRADGIGIRLTDTGDVSGIEVRQILTNILTFTFAQHGNQVVTTTNWFGCTVENQRASFAVMWGIGVLVES